MKFICSPTNLANGLQVVSRAISTRSALPILSTVLIRTTGRGVQLSATNTDVGISRTVDADVLEEGAIAAPAKLLTDFVSSLPESELEVELEPKEQVLRLRCARFDTRIKCIDADEFPPLPQPDNGQVFVVPVDEMISAVEQAAIAASADEARPILTGLLLEIGAEAANLVATDGHRLAIRRLALGEKVASGMRLVVPARALGELGRVFKGHTGELEVHVTSAGNQVFFTIPGAEVNARLIEGTYPNYTHVLPKTAATTVTFDTVELIRCVRTVSLFARDTANVVKVHAAPGSVSLSASTNEVGDSRVEIDAEVEGSEIQIAFNSRYLMDALQALHTEKVTMTFEGSLSPGTVKGSGSDEFTYIIMPVRVAM